MIINFLWHIFPNFSSFCFCSLIKYFSLITGHDALIAELKKIRDGKSTLRKTKKRPTSQIFITEMFNTLQKANEQNRKSKNFIDLQVFDNLDFTDL